MKNVLVTGGAGFIGSNFIRFILNQNRNIKIINLDKLTYAGNLESLKEFEGYERYSFVHSDICDEKKVKETFEKYNIDTVVHFAAESHVDRSILGPEEFIRTNIHGTFVLLECARKYWKDFKDKRFLHVSTDEVYGSLGETGFFTEETAYDPSSPYSASKASSDHIVRAYNRTYGLPVNITNCSNNYGGYQFPEKLIPLTIDRILNCQTIPVYGRGENIRDWLYVEDHCSAIYTVLTSDKIGETYNIGGNNEIKNIDIVNIICDLVDKRIENRNESSRNLITFVKDRPGHDMRYAIDSSKIQKELNWKPSVNFEKGIEITVDWYLENREWVKNVQSGEYRNYFKEQYSSRLEKEN